MLSSVRYLVDRLADSFIGLQLNNQQVVFQKALGAALRALHYTGVEVSSDAVTLLAIQL